MAEITEFQMMKVSSFTDGTDVYKGIKQIGYSINPLPTYGVMLEGDLRPSRHELIESDTPKVTGRLTMSGPNADALIETTIASATVTCRDVAQATGNKTITFTNLSVKGVSSGASNRTVDGATYDFEADNVVVS